MTKRTVLGVLEGRSDAEKLLLALEGAGFSSHDDASIIVANDGSELALPTAAKEGALAGGLIGGALGLLAGIGAIAIPTFGLVIVAGPVLEALGGAALGATVGSLAGALTGLGIPELNARMYERELARGKVLVAVHAEGEAQVETVRKLLVQHGAEHVCVAADTWASIDDQPTVPYPQTEIPLR
jgi:hypothetical protein